MVTKSSEEKAEEISKIDGNPIVELSVEDFYQGNNLSDVRDHLASNYSTAILTALNEKGSESNFKASASVNVNALTTYLQSKKNVSEIGSTHFRIEGENGEAEDFVLTLRRYNQQHKSAKTRSKLDASNTYLALSPDRFYLQDDENGNEQWPITFPAVSMEDSTQRISVTFDKSGYKSSTIKDKTAKSSDEPNLVFVEATPVIEPNIIDPCENCGGSGIGGGGSDSRDDDNSRGGDTGDYEDGSTYFVLKSIQLAVAGDGDGAAELQMFLQESDDYAGLNMPKKYKYRFDEVIRTHPIYGGYKRHRVITGADAGGILDAYYKVPDVNSAGVVYDSFKQFVRDPFGNYVTPPVNIGYFPLLNLSQHSGPWRLVMSDDDKDYQNFSRRRQSEYHPNINTYDMASGTYSSVETGFTVERKTYGSSDDPQWESGVRRITKSNVRDRLNSFATDIEISKNTSSGTFEYAFNLTEK